jgi:NTE family protein
VPAVVFGPDLPTHRSHPGPRIGLVFGAGGVLGAAWMTGALARLQDRLPGAAADVDLVVGTSAGSVLAAALRCRASLDEMMAWQCGDASGILSESVRLAAKDGPLPPLPHLRLGSLPLARAALLRPLQVPPWVGASGWLPAGSGQHVALRSLVSALHWRQQQRPSGGAPSHWVDGRTWVGAMDYDSGRHVLFGRQDAPPASLPDAVVASCSIPGWYEPAVIDGRRYVDGGIRSATSLSALRGTNVHEVYVLAPMASTEPDHPLQPHLQIERRFRQLITLVLLRQAKALSAEGKHVTIVTPGPRDLAVMGANLMDPRRRPDVLEVSLRTSADSLATLDRVGARAA